MNIVLKGSGFNVQSPLEEINYICLTCKELRQLELGLFEVLSQGNQFSKYLKFWGQQFIFSVSELKHPERMLFG